MQILTIIIMARCDWPVNTLAAVEPQRACEREVTACVATAANGSA